MKLKHATNKINNWWRSRGDSLSYFPEDIRQDEIAKFLGDLVTEMDFCEGLDNPPDELIYSVAEVLVRHAARTCGVHPRLAHTLADYMEF